MAEAKSHLSISKSDGVTLVDFAERKILEELSITEIGDELSRLVEGHKGIRLVVSFKNVEHLSSAALGMLITLNKKVEQLKGKLKLADISPQIFEVFKITRLNKLFEIHDTTERALGTF
jgi:anti-sigma B factor antagonist